MDYVIDEEFRLLNLPIGAERMEKLEELIKNDVYHDPVSVWQNFIIEGFEQYELYRKYKRECRIREEKFAHRNEAIILICRHQLKRTDLNTNAEAWLLSRLHMVLSEQEKPAERIIGQQPISPAGKTPQTSPAGKTPSRQLCREYHFSEATLRRYVAFGRGLDQLEERLPGVRIRVLTGELKVTREHMKRLLAMSDAELRQQLSDQKCRKLVPTELREEKAKTEKPKAPPEPKLQMGIKQMPAYDPDAELNGLTFTAESWCRAVAKVRKLTDFQATTPGARQHLTRTMERLVYEIVALNNRLEADWREKKADCGGRVERRMGRRGQGKPAHPNKAGLPCPLGPTGPNGPDSNKFNEECRGRQGTARAPRSGYRLAHRTRHGQWAGEDNVERRMGRRGQWAGFPRPHRPIRREEHE